jgi:hypothetical protein
MKMAKARSTQQRFIFLGSGKGLCEGLLPSRVSVCHDRSELAAAVGTALRGVTWVSFNRTFTEMLLEKTADIQADFRGSSLLTLAPPRTESIPALLGLFNRVHGLVDGFRWLPSDELVAVIVRDDAADRIIGGIVDSKAKAIALLRGNLKTIVAPVSLFEKSGDGTKPNFTQLEFTDWGRTVVLGDYQASADAILYELDPEYRRKSNKDRRQSERSFGASLMRLRKQRRLRRSDFSPVSSKEIARIERNEIEKPHPRTLDVIARNLGVRPEEIASF